MVATKARAPMNLNASWLNRKSAGFGNIIERTSSPFDVINPETRSASAVCERICYILFMMVENYSCEIHKYIILDLPVEWTENQLPAVFPVFLVKYMHTTCQIC